MRRGDADAESPVPSVLSGECGGSRGDPSSGGSLLIGPRVFVVGFSVFYYCCCFLLFESIVLRKKSKLVLLVLLSIFFSFFDVKGEKDVKSVSLGMSCHMHNHVLEETSMHRVDCEVFGACGLTQGRLTCP